ncbi:hypothetical protein HK096_006893, partial [Nowakowskiella sp. JEL0078]
GQVIGGSVGDYVDPFTGTGRYVPQRGSSSTNSATGGDPFTSGGGYIPSGSSVPTYNSNKLKGGNGIPQMSYILFSTANPAAILTKTLQLNAELGSEMAMLTEGEKETLDKIITLLTKPNQDLFTKNFGEKEVDVLMKISLQWPVKYRFPGIDILRLSLLYSSVPILQNDGILFDVIPEIGTFNQFDGILKKEQEPCIMLSLRLLSNLFARTEGKETIMKSKRKILEFVGNVHKGNKNKNLRFAFVTLLLNFAVLVDFLEDETENDTLARGIVAIGTLIYTYGNEVTNILNVKSLLAKIENSSLVALVSVVRQLL